MARLRFDRSEPIKVAPSSGSVRKVERHSQVAEVICTQDTTATSISVTVAPGKSGTRAAGRRLRAGRKVLDNSITTRAPGWKAIGERWIRALIEVRAPVEWAPAASGLGAVVAVAVSAAEADGKAVLAILY